MDLPRCSCPYSLQAILTFRNLQGAFQVLKSRPSNRVEHPEPPASGQDAHWEHLKPISKSVPARRAALLGLLQGQIHKSTAFCFFVLSFVVIGVVCLMAVQMSRPATSMLENLAVNFQTFA